MRQAKLVAADDKGEKKAAGRPPFPLLLASLLRRQQRGSVTIMTMIITTAMITITTITATAMAA